MTCPDGSAGLTLTAPLPGFPGHLAYHLSLLAADGAFFRMTSTKPDGPQFVLAPAHRFFPDYAPTLPFAALADLGLQDTASAWLLCLVSIPRDDVTAATANLLAPLVVNQHTGRAMQIILNGADPESIRQPLSR